MATFAIAFKGFFSQQNISFFYCSQQRNAPSVIRLRVVTVLLVLKRESCRSKSSVTQLFVHQLYQIKVLLLGWEEYFICIHRQNCYICIWSYGNLNDISIKYPLLWRDSKIPLIHLATQKFGFLDNSIPSDKVHYCVVHCITSATPLKGLIYALINREALRMACLSNCILELTMVYAFIHVRIDDNLCRWK